MNEPQIIRTAAGEELVVLSRAEYDALVAAANEAAAAGTRENFFGILAGKTQKVLTINEMNEAQTAGWAGSMNEAAKPSDTRRVGLLRDTPPELRDASIAAARAYLDGDEE